MSKSPVPFFGGLAGRLGAAEGADGAAGAGDDRLGVTGRAGGTLDEPVVHPPLPQRLLLGSDCFEGR